MSGFIQGAEKVWPGRREGKNGGGQAHLTSSLLSVNIFYRKGRDLNPAVSPNLTEYEKIVTHNDFDGIVSASLCTWFLKIQKVIFAGPLTITRSQITITEKDVVCDLPYPLQCGLWFDHHEGNLQELALRKIDPKSIPGRFDLKPVAAEWFMTIFPKEGSPLPIFVRQWRNRM